MPTSEIKKDLIDLRLTVAKIARAVQPPMSRAAVYKYLDGQLKNSSRRAEIQRVLDEAATRAGCDAPQLFAVPPIQEAV